jgi:release factor glutamine methyltransferase
VAGFVAAEDEAAELTEAAEHEQDVLERLVDRRLSGEPLAWVTGRTSFAGCDVLVHPGVYVPRWQSTELAQRARRALPGTGTAVDVCTGSGALALVLARARPDARVVASDTDPLAVANARANGVTAFLGDLFSPLPHDLLGAGDVVVAVPPYVPSAALDLLPRDTLTHEDPAHYDGGPDGTDVLQRIAREARPFLRPGGRLLLELGGTQDAGLIRVLGGLGYTHVETWTDEDGDLRGIEALAPA